MSDARPSAPAAPAAPSSGSTPPGADLRPRVEQLLSDILGLMGFPARLDFKEASDGSLSIALHFQDGLPAGVEPGKRSQVMDSLQFLLNKMLHRPGAERRFVLLGAGVHPEPRGERARREPAPPAPPAPAAAPAPAAPRTPAPARAPGRAAAPPQAKTPPAAKPPAGRAGESDERTLQVTEDETLRVAVRTLAEKSSTLGRCYALVTLKQEDRARVLKAVGDVPGLKVACEGEGRHRRVVFTPDKTAPLPKRSALPADDDEDDLEG